MPQYIKHRTSFYLGFLILLTVVTACASGGKVSKAQKAYAIGEYYRAIPLYKKAFKKEKGKYAKGELAYYLGDCYAKLNQPRKAASFFSKSVKSKYIEQPVELLLAEAYVASGKYEDALETYNEYLDRDALNRKALNGAASCKLAIRDSIKTRYVVQKEKKLSHAKYGDFCPGYASTDYDMIYFSSMRMEKRGRKRSRITGQGGCNIYMSRHDSKGEWADPEKLDEQINTSYDEGSGTLTPDGKEMYFTRCRYTNEQPMSAEVYVVGRAGGKWGEPELAPVAGDSIMAAHPAVSQDGSTIYFVSDMEGGVGGLDLWKVEKGGDSGWGEPINLGNVINTPGDEVFPYVRMDGTLYFSSDTHVGYGGLDLYKVEYNKNGEPTVINLGKPINSESDDFGIAFKGMLEEGLFSSTRESSKGIDNIWSFTLPKLEFSMKGSVLSQKTGEPIQDAYMRLIGTDGTNVKLNLLEDGTFKSKLAEDNDYVFMVAANGYFNQKENISTMGLNANQDFSFEVKLTPIEDAIILDNIYFKEGEFKLEEDAKKELQRLVNIMTANQGVIIEICAHTCQETDDETQAIVLSQQRAEAVMKYLMSKGIPTERLSAKGYGESEPMEVDRNLEAEYDFLKAGSMLTADYIKGLSKSERKKAIEINRRIEFRIQK